jgi:hypothetical protein
MIEPSKGKQFHFEMEIIDQLNSHLVCIDFLLFSSIYELKQTGIHEKNFSFIK